MIRNSMLRPSSAGISIIADLHMARQPSAWKLNNLLLNYRKETQAQFWFGRLANKAGHGEMDDTVEDRGGRQWHSERCAACGCQPKFL